VLADGKPRDMQAILDEGRKQGVFTAATTKQSVYMNLLHYIQQETAKGRKPAVVEDPISRKFRVNHPVDDWPAVTLTPHTRYIKPDALEAISTRLRSTVTGADPTAFEKAVCDAFALFGFVAQHLGGLYAPDGILDAPLGPLAYRAVLECKSTPHTKYVREPRPAEVAKFRASSKADFAVLVGETTNETDFMQEIQLHAISVWAVADIITRCATTSTPTNAAPSSRQASSPSASPISSGAAATVKKSASSSCARSSAAKATPRSAR
jgi:hypothetical protein